MAAMHSRIENHKKDYERSQHKLQAARTRAMRTRAAGYDSEWTRSQLREEFFRVTNGLVAYDWQVDVAEALILELDCIG